MGRKRTQWILCTVLIYSLAVLTSCSKEDSSPLSEQERFEQEMTAASRHMGNPFKFGTIVEAEYFTEKNFMCL